ncbi:hypothetical protein HKCCE4037_04795 [Rhodobacterales bacterium HKCCE4037]|nr:hypothetical protein [Rhodobacterales bacterium HKCCE4037]
MDDLFHALPSMGRGHSKMQTAADGLSPAPGLPFLAVFSETGHPIVTVSGSPVEAGTNAPVQPDLASLVQSAPSDHSRTQTPGTPSGETRLVPDPPETEFTQGLAAEPDDPSSVSDPAMGALENENPLPALNAFAPPIVYGDVSPPTPADPARAPAVNAQPSNAPVQPLQNGEAQRVAPPSHVDVDGPYPAAMSGAGTGNTDLSPAQSYAPHDPALPLGRPPMIRSAHQPTVPIQPTEGTASDMASPDRHSGSQDGASSDQAMEVLKRLSTPSMQSALGSANRERGSSIPAEPTATGELFPGAVARPNDGDPDLPVSLLQSAKEPIAARQMEAGGRQPQPTTPAPPDTSQPGSVPRLKVTSELPQPDADTPDLIDRAEPDVVRLIGTRRSVALPTYAWRPAQMPIAFNGQATPARSAMAVELLSEEITLSSQPGAFHSNGGTTQTSPVPLSLPHQAPSMVAQQIAAALQDRNRDIGQPIELALDPPELGRVRLQMVDLAGTLTLTIHADRPETADLMRRHMDLLAQEFAEAGVNAPSVNISHGGANGQPGERVADQSVNPAGSAPEDTAPNMSASATRRATGALDLRL